jgi:hypothetical protein
VVITTSFSLKDIHGAHCEYHAHVIALLASLVFIFTGYAKSAPLSGCYERHHDAKHPAAHKGQRVLRVILAVKPMCGSSP